MIARAVLAARKAGDLGAAGPWVISICIHVGLFLSLLLAAMVVYQRPSKELLVPNAVLADSTGGVMDLPARDYPLLTRWQKPLPRQAADDDAAVHIDQGQPQGKIPLIGVSGVGTSLLGFAAPAPAVPASEFLGSGGSAHHVVYVIDWSGSISTEGLSETVMSEMLLSISRLRRPQSFHVILFSGGRVIENPPGRLVPAEKDNKIETAEFLWPIKPEGESDPVPALMRAFDVLDESGDLPGKLIYLLSDGEFADYPGIMEAIASRNADKAVSINTFLYGPRMDNEDDVLRRAEKLMMNIASSSNGSYRRVCLDE